MIARLNLLRKLSTPIITPLYLQLKLGLTETKPQLTKIQLDDYLQKLYRLTNQGQLFSTYTQYSSKYKFNAHMYAYTCRVHAKMIRKQEVKVINTDHIFGEDFQFLENVDIDNCTITELLDIATYFNLLFMKVVINTEDKIVNKFINKLIQALMARSCRNLNDKLKIARFAQNIGSPLYSKLLEQCLSIDHQFNSFTMLSIFNSIFKGHAQTKTTQVQLDMLNKLIKSSIENQLTKKQSIHCMVDFINPIVDFMHVFNFLPEHIQTLEYFSNNLQQIFEKFYHELTGEEIIRIAKTLLQLKNPVVYKKILKVLFNSIKPDGSSSMDPIFILRVITYCRKFRICDQVDQNWQQKILKLFKYYFIDQYGIDTKPIYAGFQLCLSDGMFKHKNQIELIKMMITKINKCKSSYLCSFPLNTPYFHHQFMLFCFKNGKIKEWLSIQDHLIKITSPISSGYKFYPLFKTIVQISNIEMGLIPSQKLLVKQNFSKNIRQKFQIFTKTKLYQKSELIQLNFLQKLLSSLHCLYLHDYILALLQEFNMVKNYRQRLSTVIFQFALPSRYFSAYLKALTKFNLTRSNLANLYFAEIQKQKNIYLRCSRPQAKFFMLCISNVPDMRRFTMYSNNILCYFLMVFNRDEFMKDVYQIVEKNNLPFHSYQYLYMKMLTVLIQKSISYSQIADFVKRMGQIKFTTPRIFIYFYQKTLQSGFLSHQELIKIMNDSNLKIDESKLNLIISKNEKYYMALNFLYEIQNKLQIKNKISELMQIIEQKLKDKSFDRNILIRDFLRVLIHSQSKNFHFQEQFKNKIIGFLDKLLMENSVQMEWQVRTLQLISKLKWTMPKLAEKIWNNVNRKFEWRKQIPAEQVFKVLASDPNIDHQRLNSLIKVAQLCPDQLQYLNSQVVSKIKDKNICTPEMRKYINFMASVNKK